MGKESAVFAEQGATETTSIETGAQITGSRCGVEAGSRDGNGVIGESGAADRSGVFGFNSRPDGGAFGVSAAAASLDGPGVNGFSENGYGAVFKSARRRFGVSSRRRPFHKITRPPIFVLPALGPAMAINEHRNKPIGPGGGTRRLHQSPSA